MEKLVLERSKNTPGVIFEPNGNFIMEGRFISEDVSSFFEPLISWVKSINVESVNFTINLDFLNTSASKHLFTLLKILDENENIKEIKVKWYFEEDDEDHFEMGEYYKESLYRTQFDYHMVKDDLQAA